MTTIAAALRRWLWLLVAGCSVLPPPVGAARAQGVVPAPLQPISEPIALAIAGQPAILRVVRANESPEAVLSAIEAVWRRDGSEARRDRDGEWLSVSRIDAHGIEALQLRVGSTGGSDGYLVHWQLSHSAGALPRARDSLAHRLLPDAAVVLSDTASLAESGGGGRTLVAWLPAPPETASRLLLGRAEALGLRRRTPVHSDSKPERGRTQFYTSAGAEIALSVHTEGAGSALVIHLMETNR